VRLPDRLVDCSCQLPLPVFQFSCLSHRRQTSFPMRASRILPFFALPVLANTRQEVLRASFLLPDFPDSNLREQPSFGRCTCPFDSSSRLLPVLGTSKSSFEIWAVWKARMRPPPISSWSVSPPSAEPFVHQLNPQTCTDSRSFAG